MSSFIVRQSCMNNIINGLYWNHEFKRLYGYVLREKGYCDDDDFQRLGDELYSLNSLGTGTRYNDSKLINAVIKFEWKVLPSDSKWQVLKSMRCLRYQCSEDKAVDSELYKLLDELIALWTEYLIDEIPEYEKAKWD